MVIVTSIIGALGILIGLLFLLMGILSGGSTEYIISAVALLTSILCIVTGARSSRAKRRSKKQPEIHIPMTPEQMSAIERDELPVIYNTPVMMRAGELAHYQTPAWLTITKRKAIGSTGGGGGISFRVASGVYLHTGKSGSRRIYGDVTDTFAGDLFVTNQRIIFLQEEQGFELPIAKLTAIWPVEGGLAIQSGKKSYTLLLPSPEYPYTVIQKCFGAGTASTPPGCRPSREGRGLKSSIPLVARGTFLSPLARGAWVEKWLWISSGIRSRISLTREL